MIQFARPYIYTTSSSPALACATLASVRLAQADEGAARRGHLQQLIARFRREAALLGLPLGESPTAIQPLLVGDSGKALALAEALRAKGIWITAIRPPTVPKGSARLRITLSAAHSFAQLEQLLEALELALRESGHGEN